MPMDRQPYRIIVEGMDGTGKTTLINHLVTDFPHLQIVTRPQGREFNDWWPEEMDRQAGEPIPIYDRFFYSELVYGPIIRKRIAAEPVLLNNMVWFLRSVALLIYARPYSDGIRKAVLRSPQMEGVVTHFDALLNRYDEIMSVEKNWYGPRFRQYDWHGRDAYDDIKSVVRSYIGD